MSKKVKAISIRNGRKIFHLSSTAASDDWIRAARLLDEGKLTEFEAMDAQPMYYRPDSFIRSIKKQGKRKRNSS